MSSHRHRLRAPKVVNLALQGGGAHGAYTWGVLDRLLEDERIVIEGISATSAGAMNAAALAQGLSPTAALSGPARLSRRSGGASAGRRAGARYSPPGSIAGLATGTWTTHRPISPLIC